MCVFSMCGQILYGMLMLGCLILTCTGLFTDGWDDAKDDVKNVNFNGGLMPWNCVDKAGNQDCNDWWNSAETWYKAVVVLFLCALVLEVIALIWNLITFFTCCAKKYIIHPLTPLSLLVALCLIVGLLIFGINAHDTLDNTKNSLGWSFWVVVCAAVLATVDCVIAVVTVCLGESCL